MKQEIFYNHVKVEQMGRMHFSGNIIPINWYKNIIRKNGKPYLSAITILSEIVFWYRPTELRDERTGEFIGWQKKFKDANYLQKSYKDLADQFGMGYQEVQRAIKHLEDLGVIKRILKNVAVTDKTLSNVLFIDINPTVLGKLTYTNLQDNYPLQSLEACATSPIHATPHKVSRPLSPQMPLAHKLSQDNERQKTVQTLSKQVEKEDSAKRKNSDIYPGKQPPPKVERLSSNRLLKETISTALPKRAQLCQEPQARHLIRDKVCQHIEYETMCQNYPKEEVKEIVDVIVDVYCAPSTVIRINNSPMKKNTVVKQLMLLRSRHIESVLENIKKIARPIIHMRNYLISALYNITLTLSLTEHVSVNCEFERLDHFPALETVTPYEVPMPRLYPQHAAEEVMCH